MVDPVKQILVGAAVGGASRGCNSPSRPSVRTIICDVLLFVKNHYSNKQIDRTYVILKKLFAAAAAAGAHHR